MNNERYILIQDILHENFENLKSAFLICHNNATVTISLMNFGQILACLKTILSHIDSKFFSNIKIKCLKRMVSEADVVGANHVVRLYVEDQELLRLDFYECVDHKYFKLYRNEMVLMDETNIIKFYEMLKQKIFDIQEDVVKLIGVTTIKKDNPLCLF